MKKPIAKLILTQLKISCSDGSLSLDDCRGQTYDGATNMMGIHTGVSTKTSAEQPKVIGSIVKVIHWA